MALPAGVIQLGTFQGAKGDTGTLAFATAQSVPADQDASVVMIGPQSDRGAHFKVPRGLPGLNAVPTDEAIAAFATASDSETGQALRNNFVRALTLGEDGVENAARISAAIEECRTVAGRLDGTVIVRGVGAPIAQTIVIDGGYPNINSSLAYSTERFTFRVDGAVTFPAGVGIGFLATSGFGMTLDISVQDGGQVSDVALLVQDHQNLTLSIQGARFAGTLLKADAQGDASKRIRTSRVARVSATSCGKAIYWRSIEAFGSFDYIWDNNCVNGAEFINCADTRIDFYENYSPTTQTYGLDFVGCNSFQVGVITLGDKASTALLRIKGGDFGRINQIRTSGRPGATEPVDNGIVLDEVQSLDVDTIVTFRCAVALDVRGGGQGGIRIKQHRSMTGDVVPLRVGPGTSGTPRVTIGADYRVTRKSVEVIAGVTGGWLRLSGHIRDHHLDGPAGQYTVNVHSTVAGFELDVAGLTQPARSGLAGFTNYLQQHLVQGASRAAIGNAFDHGTSPGNAGVTPGTSWRNNTGRTAVVSVTATLAPSSTVASTMQFRVGKSADLVTIGEESAPAGTSARKVMRQIVVPPYWFLYLSAAGTGEVLNTSTVYYQ